MSMQEHAAISSIPRSPPSAWRHLLSGEYRIAGWYDRDGRRYVVARQQTGDERRGLSARERRVLAERAKGTALKVIAMDAGVSIGTVSRDLARAMQRLGLGSSSDLAAVLGHVGR